MRKNSPTLLFILLIIWAKHIQADLLDEIRNFFTGIKNDFKASVDQLKNIKNETILRIKADISKQLDIILEDIKNEALNKEEVQRAITLIIIAIVIHLVFSVIVLSYIGVSCYVMIYKQRVFSKDYTSKQEKVCYKDQDITEKFIYKK